MSTTTAPALDVEQTRTRIHDLVVIDVRTPGEYASGHLPGALNIPLDALPGALPEIREAADRGEILVVCASGARSESACALLAGHGVSTATLSGGTNAWAERGHELDRPEGPACSTRSNWSMERQVRFAAGSLVLTGAGLSRAHHPAWLLLSAGVAGGLVFSALTNTCGMAAVLAKLPHNRPRAADLAQTLERLRRG
ncbi:rhodanese-like domain-containing protein [Streptomyces sp. NPDC051018]|uniref:rhodanese-like domain-containing protein n=1 Tax=Streptomyces sp. NPDC051018 TaxID=3365639 RepID=UPI0037BE0F72